MKRIKALYACAVLAIFPFLVGFAPPDSQGTYISMAAGQGHFVSRTTGCSPPRVIDYRDVQGGVYHKYAPTPDWGGVSAGIGADFNAVIGSEKVCTTEDCEGGDSSFQDVPTLYALGPYVTLDWRWFGASLGANIPLQENPSGKRLGDDWLPTPLRGRARVGLSDLLYLDFHVGSSAPLLSDGGPVSLGVGGRLAGTDLWAGTMARGYQARVGRTLGPVRVRLSGGFGMSQGKVDGPGDETYRVRIPEYGASLGVEYRIR